MTAAQLNLSSKLLADDRQAVAIEGRIVNYLRRKSGVSLAELSRDIPGFSGGEMWGHQENNVMLWAEMSKPAIRAMGKLVSEERVTPTPTNWLVYSFDGAVLDMPLATSITERYDVPHWLPLVFAGNDEEAV